MKKTGAERALASLLAKGTVTKKEYGKINIFLLSQSTIQLPDEAEKQNVDNEIKDLNAQVQALDDQINQLNMHVAELRSVRTLSEAIAENNKLEEEIAVKEEKLSKLGDSSNLLTKEEKLEVETSYFKYLSAWKQRKKIVKNIADIICESSGMKTKEFFSEVEIELDEDANCNLNDFPDIQDPCKNGKNGAVRPKKKQKTN